MKKQFFFIWSLVTASLGVCAAQKIKQQPVGGQLIIQLHPEARIESVVPSNSLKSTPFFSNKTKRIAESVNLWLVYFDEKYDGKTLIEQIKRHPSVLNASFNYFIDKRAATTTIPNDALFAQQWHLLNEGRDGGKAGADVSMVAAWNIARSGVTKQGDTIVVAVVDDGTEKHEDLDANRWRNWLEIPKNGIDDDQNGFVDDYFGWNTLTRNDDLAHRKSTYHGLEVEGVLGAVGNNSIGLTGTAWQVKMMPVVFGETVDEVLACYDYVVKMRRLYNQTNGRKGAFIVVANSSFGIPGTPEQVPGWCELIESMGKEGILTIGAAPNSDLNVDVSPDLPAFCPSDYVVVTTVNDREDNFVRGYGYGTRNVDITAPGINVLTTFTQNTYLAKTGTSLSTPIISGIAALAYATDCDSLVRLVKARPTEGVLALRKILLENVDILDNLKNRVGTSGRVNAVQSLKAAVDLCRSCRQPLRIKPNVGKTVISFTATLAEGNELEIRYRTKNGIWSSPQKAPTPPLSISGLKSCSEYEFEVRSVCGKGVSDSIILPLRTYGCDVEIFPNPFTQDFNIDNRQTSSTISLIRIYAPDGRLVLTKKTNIGNEIAPLTEVSSLSAGLYFIKMTVGTTEVTKKIVKTN